MKIDFWFDPICPWCWVTSRWITSIADERDLDITWRSISLKLKNEITDEGHPFFGPASFTHGLLRVTEAMRAGGDEALIGAAYREWGRRIHQNGERDPFDVAESLTAAGVDPAYAAAAGDDQWEAAVVAELDEGIGLVGADVGTPIIAVTFDDGRREAFFGPVITSVPEGDMALQLWDGLVALMEVPQLYELKRTRTTGPTFPAEI